MCRFFEIFQTVKQFTSANIHDKHNNHPLQRRRRRISFGYPHIQSTSIGVFIRIRKRPSRSQSDPIRSDPTRPDPTRPYPALSYHCTSLATMQALHFMSVGSRAGNAEGKDMDVHKERNKLRLLKNVFIVIISLISYIVFVRLKRL